MPEEAEELEDGKPRRRFSVMVFALLIIVIVQVTIIINLYLSYVVAKEISTREKKAQEFILEEEKSTAQTVQIGRAHV